MRRFVILLPLLLGQCLGGSTTATMSPVMAQRLILNAVPVVLDAAKPDRVRVGALTLIGGWQLTSDFRPFGGLSSLNVEGNHVTALGDAGSIVRFRIGRFGHASDASIVPVPRGCGPERVKSDRDTESLAHDPVSGSWWIGYEWRNAICRTNRDFTIAQRAARPPAMRDWPRTGGAETILRLNDARVLILAERAKGTEERPLLIYHGDPTDAATPVDLAHYVPPDGFSPTDAAQLPDGRILILNRSFNLWGLFTAKLVLADQPVVRGAVLKGRVIATLAPPLIADNFEGLSVTVENGRPIVWMVSDDNFMRWQRTLLLKFALN